MNEEQQRAWELVLRHRDFYGTYHHHKETMAYGATAFYLAGISAFIFGSGWPNWDRPLRIALIPAIIAAAALALRFILWQFERRIFGADMVAACSDLLAEWVISPPTRVDLAIRTLNFRQWPAALVERFEKTRQRGCWLPRELTWIAIAFWTLAALVRIGATLC
jgi:hypothetical protein